MIHATALNWQTMATQPALGLSAPPIPAAVVAVQDELRRWLPGSFVVVDADTGAVLGDCPRLVTLDAWEWWRDLARAATLRGKPELLDEIGPVGIFAAPLPRAASTPWVAVGIAPIRAARADESLAPVAQLLGASDEAAARWLAEHESMSPAAFARLAVLVAAKIESDLACQNLQNEADALAVQLTAQHEEIGLLYRLTQNLKLTRRKDELCRLALDWLADVLPARAIAIQLAPTGEMGPVHKPGHDSSLWLTRGDAPLSSEEFSKLIEHLGLDRETHSTAMHAPIGADTAWPQANVRQMLVAPLGEGPHLFGYLAAFNHVDDAEFGAVESNLMSSVAAILGIHGGNIELYRQQREFLAGVVRALTSAIDAKDSYTCGHSERVADVAVQIGRELAFDKEQLSTLYLSGLLHDIGKIGIDNQVLNKPGPLTPEEFEHIKTHSEIGYRILKDLKQLDQVLPVVLHHHEQWDGRGYPRQLAGEDIPLLARIVAVADAFDAMGSDRPYRPGMNWEKIRGIFAAGAGKQWDAQIVEAFMRTRVKLAGRPTP